MAKSKAITYSELVEFLAHLGYTRDPAQSSDTYTVFTHPGRSLPLFLQVFKPRTPIRPIFLVTIKGILKDSAPTEAEEFEAWLESRMPLGGRRVPAQ
jgi:hypothetical protein